MVSPAAKDYSQLVTWKNMDLLATSVRIATDHNGCNLSASRIAGEIFRVIDASKRAEFFHQCEQNNLKGSRFITAFQVCCEENNTKFIDAVLKADKTMIERVGQIEEINRLALAAKAAREQRSEDDCKVLYAKL